MTKAHKFQEFHLFRKKDISGVSGAGVVARGVIFPKDGKVAMEWTSEFDTVTIFASIDEVVGIHGHGGSTIVIMGPPPEEVKKPKKKVKP